MLVASLRELKTHAQKVRIVIGSTLGRRDLGAQCTGDKLQATVNIRVGDGFSEIGSGPVNFVTTLSGVLGSYIETWSLCSDDEYALIRAYLHLHVSSSPTEPLRELVFVHTEPVMAEDPADAMQMRTARWRSGPHLHVKASHFGFGRCHIHLDSCNVPCRALESLRAYRQSLQAMIEMLWDELTEHFDLSQTICIA